ncbi:MAG: hydroxyisourate hydrolase [Planctomycetota bacterium]
MSPITTHVLDTALGRPAEGVQVALEKIAPEATLLAEGLTNADGRIVDLLPERAQKSFEPGRYRLTFHTGAYCARANQPCFYPQVVIDFEVVDPAQHYHVPLLLSPFGYSTYRGS